MRPTNQVAASVERRDFAGIRKAAAAQVAAELGAIADPRDRLQRAGEIIRQAELEVSIVAPERNACAASLAFYDGMRGLNVAMGVGRASYAQIRRAALGEDTRTGRLPEQEEAADVAEAADVPRVKDAAKRLPELSERVAAANARHEAAVPFRQDAALVVSEEPYGWSSFETEARTGIPATRIREDLTHARRRRQASKSNR